MEVVKPDAGFIHSSAARLCALRAVGILLLSEPAQLLIELP
jgi:hypothetical protein